MSIKNTMKEGLKFSSAFTLVEILIVIALIVLIASVVLTLLNPWRQIDKAKDAKRKHDLNVLQTAFEDYYNDNGCYPRPEHVCYDYDQTSNACSISKTVTSKLCHICGTKAKPPLYSEIQKYLPELPCDPDSPRRDYLYEVQIPGCSRNNGPNGCVAVGCPSDYCPQWYRAYSDFANNDDTDSIDLGCAMGGCGPTGTPFGYDYGVSSHQVGIEKSDNYWGITAQNICNTCGLNYQACLDNNNFPNKQEIYSSSTSCCAAHPGTQGC